MSRDASATSKLEKLFWKLQAALPYEKIPHTMREAMKENWGCGTPYLTTANSAIPREEYYIRQHSDSKYSGNHTRKAFTGFENACKTLLWTISTQFQLVNQVRVKRNMVNNEKYSLWIQKKLILYFNQVLRRADKSLISLINTNQIRNFDNNNSWKCCKKV